MYIKNGQFKKHKYIISYVPPQIYVQPVGGTRKSGQSFTFTIKARGSNPIKYQWYKNDFPIFGATSNVLSIPVLDAYTHDGFYYCKILNHKYPIDSDVVKLNVISTITIVSQPSSVRVNPKVKSSFTVGVTGTPPIKYQWYLNSLPIKYGTKTSYMIPYTQFKDEGTYYCLISNNFDTLTTNFVYLSVNKPVVVLKTPASIQIDPNQTITDYLSCTGTIPITGYWRKNRVKYGTDVEFSNGRLDFVINNTQSINSGTYDCVLTNVVSSVTSNPFVVYVNEPVGIVSNLSSVTKFINESHTFTFGVTGTTPINYQWYSSDGILTGERTANYKISSVEFSSEKRYWCTASNMLNTVTSFKASLSADAKFITDDNSDYIMLSSGVYWMY